MAYLNLKDITINNFDKIFYNGQRTLISRAGQTIKYYYDQNAFIETKAIFGSKKMLTQSNSGLVTQSKQLYFAIDGKYLVTDDTVPQLITPTDGHYIVFDTIQYEVSMVNDAYYESVIQNGMSAGLLKIWVTQRTQGVQ